MAKKLWFGLTVVVVAAACGLAGFLWHNRSLSAGAVETPPVLELPPEPAEASTEQASESGRSDGPGGYADSNANADTQQQGEN